MQGRYTVLTGTLETGVVLDIESGGCEARHNGQVIKWHPLQSVAEAALKARGVDLRAEPQTVTERQAKPRCDFYKNIRRCYAIFQVDGVPTDQEGMRLE